MVMVPLTIKNGDGPRRPYIKNGNGDGLIYSDSIQRNSVPFKGCGVFDGFRVLNFFEKNKKNKIEKINNFLKINKKIKLKFL